MLADTVSGATLQGRTRRYRIYVAARAGAPFRLYEFSLWVQDQWRRFRDARGIPHTPYSGSPSMDVWLVMGLDKAQRQIDDWLEAQFGCAAETDPDPLGE